MARHPVSRYQNLTYFSGVRYTAHRCLVSIQVRIVVTFRGREQSHMDLGNVLLEKVTKDLDVSSQVVNGSSTW